MSSSTTSTVVVAVLHSALSRLPAVITSVCEVRLVRVYDKGPKPVCRALYAEVLARSPASSTHLCDVYLLDLNILGTSLHSPLHDLDMWSAVCEFAKQLELPASRAYRILPAI